MESNFRSTVLQRHADDDERDRDKYHRRDVMNPAGTHRHSSTFTLRSPTLPHADYHPSPYPPSSSSSPNHNHNRSPSRPSSRPPQPPSSLHNRSPYMSSADPAVSTSSSSSSSSSSAHPLPPPVGLSHSHSTSPLHPPTGYYPPPTSASASSESHQHHHHSSSSSRDTKPATGGRVYDPTTDTTKERRISDSWHNSVSGGGGSSSNNSSSNNAPQQVVTPKPREPYQYPPVSVDQHQPSTSNSSSSYYNGNYSSPRQRTSSFGRPLSPLPHSHSNSHSHSHASHTAYASPPRRHPHMTSPSLRHAPPSATSVNSSHDANNANGTSSALPPMMKSDLAAPSPPKPMAASLSAPSRAADPMSFSTILSNSEPASASSPPPAPAFPSTKPATQATTPKPLVARLVPTSPSPPPPHPPPAAAASDSPDDSASASATATATATAKASAPVFKLREPDHDGDTEMDKDDTEPEPEPVPAPVKKSVTTIKKRDRESQREKEKEKDKGKDRGREKDKEKNRDKDKEKEKGARKSTSKGRVLDIKEAEAPKKSRRVSVKKEKESSTPRPPSKRQANGLPKQKTWSTEMERKIQNAEMQIQNDASKLDPLEFDEDQYKSQARKRRRIMAETDADQHTLRLHELVNTSGKRLAEHAELGKRRYDDVFYDEALREVRDQELYAEKERKKDMQRKRRREKSMAVTIEQKEAALARAEAAEDEAERQKHLRDAERANKKAQQTKLILQKGIKGPARNVELNLEGGTTSSFQASDVETPKAKSKRSGNRPKKSKEQKQAEKDSAEAAQAALDAGEELPPPKEEARVRIKIKGKSKTADADKPAKEKAESAKDNKVKEKEKEKELEKEKVEEAPEPPEKFVSKGYNQIYDQIWRDMARKDVSKTFKLAVDSYATRSSNLKKTAILASKEAKRWQLRTNKGTKDLQARAKRVMRDMMSFWKRNEREERDLRKAAEKQEIENARKEEADREAARQKRKLNFLISQTELYSHFIGKKIKTDEVERSTDNPDIAPDANEAMQNNLSINEPTGPMGSKVTRFENLDFDDEDETALQAAAMANAQNAIAEAQKKARAFNNHGLDMDDEGEMNFQNPTGLGDVEIEQPKLINAQLKEYQLKGLNWLVNLYEQGINGILADEMGLGKTVQSISVMAYLAEKHDIWGPFLVVAPASTLHNWQQEIAKFVPEFKILPYWGSASDRKVLRKFWDRKHTTYKKDAPFHVCVTSYQLVVSDVAYFQKMRWQYMILDEAQAIKSSQSSRWKCLLGFHCRNRLLLTGTPIQNNMQELWALLHFIMPSLFDSHDEFSEWFSKDIESHAQSNTKLNEDQLKRLHMILKPFMLRRVKKHVQKELGDKIEMDVFCNLTYRQRAFYSNLRNQINIMDLVEKATMGDDQDSGTLMNLVMQFRKVCNHPDLFERAEVTSSYSFGYFAETASFVREGSTVAVGYSARSLIDFRLPSLVWAEGGRLDRPGKDNDKAGWRNKALGHLMNIWAPDNVQASLDENKAFSWLRFADATPGDVYKTAQRGLFDRAVDELRKRNRLALIREAYEELNDQNFTPAHCLFKIRERENILARAEAGHGVLDSLMNISRVKYRDSGLGRLEMAARPRVSAPPIEASCNKPSSMVEREKVLFNAHIRKTLYGPTLFEERSLIENKLPMELYPSNKLLPPPDQEKRRFTNITVPSMHRFVTDSGKLKKLDELLFKLKNEGHRVLLYFQMTRMIDMMEDYLTYRNYKYCRLDGSTKLEDRRDTVHDFQTRPEIFIFLLSTRAGGLGINLTSADTVIFYDSDWNPTIDSQAMDRAHRLGQTRQVTVYRLITRGTIEERIRKRALQKEEVQRVVIQGGGASVDFSGRRAPENRNRDIAMWLADDEQAEMIERRERELLESGEYEKQKKKGGKRKKAEAPASLDDMYHEGEGNFDDGTKIGASGTATPAEAEPNKGKKGRAKGGGKRAKTTTQRLALADGIIDI